MLNPHQLFIYKFIELGFSSNVLKLIVLWTLQVIAFDINMPVKQAFHILYEQVDLFYVKVLIDRVNESEREGESRT